jgi:predicted helicase
MAERLGIVYTPVEVVDFIIHSVQDVLRDEFNSGLGEKDVHIIDPFTGTGTFLVRLLQSGLIPPERLLHKYQHELHANEIVLLAYYIAAINIEETFHGIMAQSSRHAPRAVAPPAETDPQYIPFDGICLTDTFQLYESGQQAFEGTFPENSARVKRQKASPIRVVIANPPYSSQQESENDNNQNIDYPLLDRQIRTTYAERSASKLSKYLYSSEVRALRWATDRVGDRGVVSFVTNNAFLDRASTDGIRDSLPRDFSSIHIFNLRGLQRGVSGEFSRREGGKIFGGGSRNGIAIIVLVKNTSNSDRGVVHYHDIGEYLSTKEKLQKIGRYGSIAGIANASGWSLLQPNAAHDWINQRDPAFERFVMMATKDASTETVIFSKSSFGVVTGRDAWVYNASKQGLALTAEKLVNAYMLEMKKYETACEGLSEDDQPSLEDVADMDAKRISWTRSLKSAATRNKPVTFVKSAITVAMYRPFNKLWMYYDRRLNEMPSLTGQLFPKHDLSNIAICTTGVGNRDEFSVLVTSVLPDMHMTDKSGASQCFPLYLYEASDKSGEFDYGDEIIDGYRRRDAITDAILKTFRAAYGPKVTKKDIFYYVYGILHSPEYRTRFASDLKKMLPRIPLTKETKDFKAFSDAGRKLAEWHLNYETVEPWPLVEHMDKFDFNPWDQFKVQKMNFARPTAEQKAAGAKYDKTQIIYNSHLTLKMIPLEAYDYVVNGKPALEWIIERYQVSRDKDSGILNDPNDWCKEHNQPRYIVDLLARIVRVSIETMKIVNSLPSLNEC